MREMDSMIGPQTPSLLQRLREIAQSIPYIEKGGRNDAQRYDYVQNVDVVREIRSKLFEKGIMVIPGASEVINHAYTSARGAQAFLTNIQLRYEFACVDSGERITVPWVGAGSDTGGDKGLYKAYTGGLKYALLALFLIPTTNDPERDQLSEDTTVIERPAAPPIPRDRAQAIFDSAVNVKLADREKKTLHPVMKAKLATIGVERISLLNVDQAEVIEEFLRKEKS